MRLRLALAPLALALAAPVAAGAATLQTDKGCYLPGEAVHAFGAGFTPGSPVDFYRDGVYAGSIRHASGTGTVTVLNGLTAPLITVRQRTFDILASDAAHRGNAAAVSPLVSKLDVTVRPPGGAPGRLVRIRARGFVSGHNLYAHIRRGRHYHRNLRIGRLHGACGRLRVRKRVFSADTPSGTYKLQFDSHRRYSRRTRPYVRFRVRISGGVGISIG
jgi:hypothetical protein